MIRILFLLMSISSFAQKDVRIQLSSTATLELQKLDFDPKGHKIEMLSHPNVIIGIDDIPLFGSDGDMPKSYLSAVTLTIGDRKYNLQIDNMYDPWSEGTIEKRFIIEQTGENYAVLRGVFSDGAGTYGAEWLITGNSSVRTIFTNDENILFQYFEY